MKLSNNPFAGLEESDSKTAVKKKKFLEFNCVAVGVLQFNRHLWHLPQLDNGANIQVDEKFYSLRFKFFDMTAKAVPNNRGVDAYVLSFESLEGESGKIVLDFAQRFLNVFQPGSLPLVLIGSSTIDKFYEERQARMIPNSDFSQTTTIALQLPEGATYPFYESAVHFAQFGQMIVKHIFDTRAAVKEMMRVKEAEKKEQLRLQGEEKERVEKERALERKLLREAELKAKTEREERERREQLLHQERVEKAARENNRKNAQREAQREREQKQIDLDDRQRLEDENARLRLQNEQLQQMLRRQMEQQSQNTKQPAQPAKQPATKQAPQPTTTQNKQQPAKVEPTLPSKQQLNQSNTNSKQPPPNQQKQETPKLPTKQETPKLPLPTKQEAPKPSPTQAKPLGTEPPKAQQARAKQDQPPQPTPTSQQKPSQPTQAQSKQQPANQKTAPTEVKNNTNANSTQAQSKTAQPAQAKPQPTTQTPSQAKTSMQQPTTQTSSQAKTSMQQPTTQTSSQAKTPMQQPPTQQKPAQTTAPNKPPTTSTQSTSTTAQPMQNQAKTVQPQQQTISKPAQTNANTNKQQPTNTSTQSTTANQAKTAQTQQTKQSAQLPQPSKQEPKQPSQPTQQSNAKPATQSKQPAQPTLQPVKQQQPTTATKPATTTNQSKKQTEKSAVQHLLLKEEESFVLNQMKRFISLRQKRSGGPDNENKACAICSKEQQLLRCTRCTVTWYCGKEHQSIHWPVHREECVHVADLQTNIVNYMRKETGDQNINESQAFEKMMFRLLEEAAKKRQVDSDETEDSDYEEDSDEYDEDEDEEDSDYDEDEDDSEEEDSEEEESEAEDSDDDFPQLVDSSKLPRRGGDADAEEDSDEMDPHEERFGLGECLSVLPFQEKNGTLQHYLDSRDKERAYARHCGYYGEGQSVLQQGYRKSFLIREFEMMTTCNKFKYNDVINALIPDILNKSAPKILLQNLITRSFAKDDWAWTLQLPTSKNLQLILLHAYENDNVLGLEVLAETRRFGEVYEKELMHAYLIVAISHQYYRSSYKLIMQHYTTSGSFNQNLFLHNPHFPNITTLYRFQRFLLRVLKKEAISYAPITLDGKEIFVSDSHFTDAFLQAQIARKLDTTCQKTLGNAILNAVKTSDANVCSLLLDLTKGESQYATALNTALLYACTNMKEKFVAALLNAGADPASKDKFGNSITHSVAETGKKKIVELFMEKRVDFTVPANRYSKRPIDVANATVKNDILKYQARLVKEREEKALEAKKKAQQSQQAVNNTATTSAQNGASTPSNAATGPHATQSANSHSTTTASSTTSNTAAPVSPEPAMDEKVAPRREKEMLSQLDATAMKAKFYEITADEEGSLRSAGSGDASATKEAQAVLEADHELEAMIAQIAEAAWDITWSRDAYSSFRKLDSFAKKVVLRRLISLAQGERSLKSTRQLKTSQDHSSLILYEADLLHGYRMIWQTEILFSSRLNCYAEVILIWDIVKHKEISTVVQRVERAKTVTKTQTREKLLEKLELDACKPAATYVPPSVVSPSSDASTYPRVFKEKSSEALQRQQEERERVTHVGSGAMDRYFSERLQSYVLEKFYEASLEVLRHLVFSRSNLAIELPLNVTKEEYYIICSRSNVLLLGRSGTGKTTCAVLRMWSWYRAFYQENRFDVTSPIASKRVALTSAELLSSTSTTTGSTAAGTLTAIPSTETGIAFRQVFLTVSPILARHVRQYFEGLLMAHNMSVASLGQSVVSLADVPEAAWPLITTYSQFLRMIDGSLEHQFFVGVEEQQDIAGGAEYVMKKEDVASVTSANLKRKLKRCSYALFCSEIWPLINKDATLHPSLVWAEIQSFIKGSSLALEQESGVLSEEDYSNIGKKRASMFKDCRSLIYDYYRKYEKEKKKLFMYDDADAVFHIYSQIQQFGYHGHRVQSFTVDEVQDCSEAMLQLLFLISNNPDGFFFCGDTAQTIEQGVAFRFCDVTSLFFKNQHRCSIPPVQKLTKSFRSTSEILFLANTVLEIIECFFPETVDILPKDLGMYAGTKPVIFPDTTESNLLNFFMSQSTGASIEFGHEQTIIVREERDKKKLPKILKGNIVLTVAEAKGLEFEDVLVYNFFSDSPLSNEWRVIHSYVKNSEYANNVTSEMENGPISMKKMKSSHMPNYLRELQFDPTKHQLLCSELKKLYMIITRAKSKLCFFDNSVENRSSVEDLWRKREAFTYNVEEGGMKIKTSTQAQWQETGVMFFQRERYRQAAHCFTQCNNMLLKDKSLAFYSLNKAKGCKDPAKVVQRFKKSATSFSELAQKLVSIDKEEAKLMEYHCAHCLYMCGDYHNASQYFLRILPYKKWSSELYLFAASSFEKSQHIVEAVQVYILMNDYEKSSDLLYSTSRAKYVEFILKYHKNLEPLSKKQRIRIEESISYCKASPTLENSVQTLIQLLPIKEQVQFCVREKLYREAAEVLRGNNDAVGAASLLEKYKMKFEAGEILQSVPGRERQAAECFLVTAKELFQELEKTPLDSLLFQRMTAAFQNSYELLEKIGEEASYITFLIANFDVSEAHLHQLLEVTKDKADIESELARLQALETLRGKYSDHSTEVTQMLLQHYMLILPVLSSNLSQKGKSFGLVMKYYGLAIHPSSEMLYVDRNNRKIPAKFEFPEIQEKSASTQKVVVRQKYLGLLTNEVYELYVECFMSLFNPLRNMPNLCFKYLQGLKDFKCKCKPAEKARLHHPQQAQHVFQEGLTRLMAKCTLLYETHQFLRDNVDETAVNASNGAAANKKKSPVVSLWPNAVLKRKTDIARDTSQAFTQLAHLLCATFPIFPDTTFYFAQSLTPALTNGLAELGLDLLDRKGPSPYAFEPEDKGTRLNRTDTVIKSSHMCAVLGNKEAKFYEKLQSYKYPDGLNVAGDQKKGYFFHTDRLVTIHYKYMPQPLCLDHAAWNLQYLQACKEQECLPSPDLSLKIVTQSLLLVLTQYCVHRKSGLLSSVPYSYYTAYMKNHELAFFQSDPAAHPKAMVTNLAAMLDCLCDCVLHSFIPQKYLGNLKVGEECVHKDGTAYLRLVPENTVLAAVQLAQFLWANLSQQLVMAGPKGRRKKQFLMFTEVHKASFERIYSLLAYWTEYYKLPRPNEQPRLETRGDVYVNFLIHYANPIKLPNRRPVPVLSTLTIRLANMPDAFRVIFANGLLSVTPPLMPPILLPEEKADDQAADDMGAANAIEATHSATHSNESVTVAPRSYASMASSKPTLPDYFSFAVVPSADSNHPSLLAKSQYDAETLPSILGELSQKLIEFSRAYQSRSSSAKANATAALPATTAMSEGNENEEAMLPKLKRDKGPDLPLDASKGKIWCQYWHDRGRCMFGSKCKFYHPPSLAAPQFLNYEFGLALRESATGRVDIVRVSDQKAEREKRRLRDLDAREKQREELEHEAREKERLNAEVFGLNKLDAVSDVPVAPQINTVPPAPSLVIEIERKTKPVELPTVVPDAEQRNVIEEDLGDDDEDYEEPASVEKAMQLDDRFTASKFSETEVAAAVTLQRKIRRFLDIRKVRQSLRLKPGKDSAAYFVHDAKCLLCNTKYLSTVDFAHHKNSPEHAKTKRLFAKAVEHYESILMQREELSAIYAKITQFGPSALKRNVKKKSVAIDDSVLDEHIMSYLSDELDDDLLLEKFANREFDEIARVDAELEDFFKNSLGLVL